MSGAELLHKVTFEASSVDTLPYERLREVLSDNSLLRIRGLADPDSIRSIRRRMAARFDPTRDRKHDPRDTDAVRSNFQKIVLGAGQGEAQHMLARFVRIFYNPIFCDDIHGMREHFVTLARFRNLMGGAKRDFAVHGIDEQQFTAARIQQYPRGGGFMGAHQDHFSPTTAALAGAGFAQPVLVMSQHGEDYAEGGAFLVRDGERLQYEQHCQPGDVIVYDGRSLHGVADVDPLAPIDLSTFSGRVVAMASLYRVLEPGSAGYRELDRTARAHVASVRGRA